MAELTNASEGSKMTILNLFFQILKNTQPRKPAPCLALRPFSLIFPMSQILKKYAMQTSQIYLPSPQPTKALPS